MILWLMYYIFNLTFFVMAQFFLRKVKNNKKNSWKFISHLLYVFWIAVTRVNFLVLRKYSRMWNTWNMWFLYFFPLGKLSLELLLFFSAIVSGIIKGVHDWYEFDNFVIDYYAVVNFLRLTFQKILLSQSLPLHLSVLSPSKMQIFFSHILAFYHCFSIICQWETRENIKNATVKEPGLTMVPPITEQFA